MTKRIMPFERAIQVLGILARQGPMSIRGLSAVLEPPIERRRLRAVLNRLKQKGVLKTRFDSDFGRSAVYHYIAQDSVGRELAAKALKVDVKDVEHKHSYYNNLKHTESCAVWAEKLRSYFPDGAVIRDHNFKGNELLESRLFSSAKELELRPDLVIVDPTKDGKDKVVVGVEIERTMKSKKRLANKFMRYTARTLLDGLIYICERDVLGERLEQVYTSTVLERALRVKSYGQNFLLFTKTKCEADRHEPILYNASLQAVSLRHWMRILCEIPPRERKDFHFTGRADGASPFLAQ